MIVSAIIPVAGIGRRFGGTQPKQYLEIGGRSVIARTVEKILSVQEIDHGVVVVAESERETINDILSKLPGFNEKFSVASGGKERQDSVYNGLQVLPSRSDIVLVHDGVRPFISPQLLLQSIQTAAEFGACVVAVPVKDTIKRVADGQVIETVPREELWQIQTPQTFRFSILKDAHEKARKSGYYSTDESALAEWAGYPVRIVPGDYLNIKLTTMEDLLFSRMLLAEGLVE